MLNIKKSLTVTYAKQIIEKMKNRYFTGQPYPAKPHAKEKNQ